MFLYMSCFYTCHVSIHVMFLGNVLRSTGSEQARVVHVITGLGRREATAEVFTLPLISLSLSPLSPNLLIHKLLPAPPPFFLSFCLFIFLPQSPTLPFTPLFLVPSLPVCSCLSFPLPHSLTPCCLFFPSLRLSATLHPSFPQFLSLVPFLCFSPLPYPLPLYSLRFSSPSLLSPRSILPYVASLLLTK